MCSRRTDGCTAHVASALRILALAAVVAAGVIGPALAQPPVEAHLRVYPLDVFLNGAPVGLWPVVERDGQFYAPPEAFEAWRVQRPAQADRLEYRGLAYFALSALPGADVKVDAVENSLRLNVRAEAFTGVRLRAEDRHAAPPRSEIVPSAFLNYDVSLTDNRARDAANSRSLGVLGELGTSGAWGVLTNSFAARNLLDDTPGMGPRVLRLETTLRRDMPEAGYTINIGDGITRTGYLGRPAVFGGLQIGTNFGLAPQVNRRPLPVVMGQTLTPSTVQLYVNDVLRQTAKVPAGPFTLDAIPAISGNGDVSVVVRDILGRETVITQPFFVASDLLAPGLNDWSVEAGKLRQDLGSASSHYADAFASGMWRRGLTSTFTAEGRAETTRSRSTVAMAGLQAIGGQLLARVGAATSHDDVLGSGHRWSGSLDWRGRVNSGLLSAEASSRSFRYLGESVGVAPPRLQVAAQAGLFLANYGRLGAGLAVQYPYDLPRIATASLSYTAVLRDNWQVITTLSRAFGSTNATTLAVMLNIPLSKRNMSTTSVQARTGQTDAYESVSHSPDAGYGTAWRVLGGEQAGRPRAETAAYYFGPQGIASAELSATPEETHLRLGANGGLLYTTGKVFALPHHDTSAALVRVAGYSGIGVGLGQQVSTHTDADGYALVSRLNAYQANPIRLDPNDLPITAEIDSIEIPAVPPWRAVALVDFPVRGGRGAMIPVLFEDGKPAPMGATVHIEGEDRQFYVGRKGEAYVTGLKDRNRLRLRWHRNTCDLDVQLPPGKLDEVARVAPVTCQGAMAR